VLDLTLLSFKVGYNLVNSLQVLISINILRHGLPLLLNLDQDLLLVVKLKNGVLDLFLNTLDLLVLVLILDSLILDLLLLGENLIIDWLLVFFPLFT